MKISNDFINYQTSFGTRNKYIREADDIRRKAGTTFPRISSTYVDDFYISANPQRKTPRNERVREISKKIEHRIETVRDIIKDQQYYLPPSDERKNTPYGLNLYGVELSKAGNCKEAAITALAALCANGYYESERAELFLKTQFINKKTGKIEYEASDPLDHSFVLTTMNRKPLAKAREKDLIVLDPWIGFTDSLSGAKGRFKQVYSDDSYDEITSFRRSMFRLEKVKKENILINFDDYDIKQKFIIKTPDLYTPYQLRTLGNYAQNKYHSLVKTPQSTQANI